MTSSAVEPGHLLKQLRGLWSDLGKADPNGVLRACAMTLVVVVDEAHDAQLLGETLASLMHAHPSRALVVRVRQCAGRVLEARVFAQCWKPFGARQQICCEQVEIISSPDSLADVAAVIRGLIVPDLPVVLFSPSETLWWLPQFQALLPLAGKVILDSCGMPESPRVLTLLKDLPANVKRRADLVWSRLTPWREAIAQIFESPSRRNAVYDLSEIRILYKSNDEPSAVYYLGGWFVHVLGAGVPVRIAAGVGPEFVSIAHVAIEGPKLKASVEITDRNTAETRVNDDPPQVTVLPVASETYALREELSVGERDRLFEDVLGLANVLRGAA